MSFTFWFFFFFGLLHLQMSNSSSIAHTPIFAFVSRCFCWIWFYCCSFCAGVFLRHRASVVRWCSRLIVFQNYWRWAGGSQSQREPWEHIKAAGALWWSCGLLPETFGYNQSHLRQGGSPCSLRCWLDSETTFHRILIWKLSPSLKGPFFLLE